MGNHVNDTGEIILPADRQADGVGISSELLAHLQNRIFEIGTHAVHLVDERDPRDIVFGCLTPNRFGLRLHPCDSAKHGDRTVQHAHGSLHLSGKIHMPRGINDVDPMRNIDGRLVQAIVLLGPVTGGRRRRDRNAALPLLLHPVRHRISIMHIAHLMDESRVKENTLRCGGFPGINVRRNTNIAGTLHRVLPLWGIQGTRFFNYCVHLSVRIKMPRPASAFGANWKLTVYQRKCANALLA